MESEKSVSGKQFLDILQRELYSGNRIVNYTVIDDVNFNQIDFESILKKDNLVTKVFLISHCTFIGNVEIKDIKEKFKYLFFNCTFKKDLIIKNSIADEINIQNSSMSKLYFLYSACHMMTISNLRCGVAVVNSSLTEPIDHLTFFGLKCSQLELAGYDYKSVHFYDMECEQIRIYPRHSHFYDNELLEISGRKNITRIDEFSIYLNDKSNSLELFSIHIGRFQLTGNLEKKSFFMRDVEMSSFNIINFINNGKVRFHDIRMKNAVECTIADSQLDKMNFSNVDFSKVPSFKIYLSNLTEIITTNTHFVKVTGKNIEDHSETREAYRQLKFAASKQGDKIRELEYAKQEMIYYQKTLNMIKNFKDWIIVGSNWLSNDHGQNYLYAIGWFIPITIVFFMCIKINLGYSFHWGGPSAEDCSQYLESALNPLHDFNKVFNLDTSQPVSKARVIDAFSKLISGYLIFQFLSAFRKYVK